jgi:hypothetical protein
LQQTLSSFEAVVSLFASGSTVLSFGAITVAFAFKEPVPGGLVVPPGGPEESAIIRPAFDPIASNAERLEERLGVVENDYMRLKTDLKSAADLENAAALYKSILMAMRDVEEIKSCIDENTKNMSSVFVFEQTKNKQAKDSAVPWPSPSNYDWNGARVTKKAPLSSRVFSKRQGTDATATTERKRGSLTSRPSGPVAAALLPIKKSAPKKSSFKYPQGSVSARTSRKDRERELEDTFVELSSLSPFPPSSDVLSTLTSKRRTTKVSVKTTQPENGKFKTSTKRIISSDSPLPKTKKPLTNTREKLLKAKKKSILEQMAASTPLKVNATTTAKKKPEVNSKATKKEALSNSIKKDLNNNAVSVKLPVPRIAGLDLIYQQENDHPYIEARNNNSDDDETFSEKEETELSESFDSEESFTSDEESEENEI